MFRDRCWKIWGHAGFTAKDVWVLLDRDSDFSKSKRPDRQAREKNDIRNREMGIRFFEEGRSTIVTQISHGSFHCHDL